MASSGTYKGVVRGNTIELERRPDMPDGQQVTVRVEPAAPAGTAPVPGEAPGRAFGGWAEDGEALDAFLEWNRRQRKQSRPDPQP